MPFRLTNEGEYAVRLMVYLAGRNRDQLVSAREIADNQDIPQRFLRTIVSQFVKLGFIKSFQGNGGGVRLAEGAENKTLLEVIEAVEGPIYLNVCMQGEVACQFSNHCAVHLVWHEAQDAIQKILGGKKIKELAQVNFDLAAKGFGAGSDTMCGIPVNTEDTEVTRGD
ncbi:MAG: Rrf2 family transcriptional regulator [FCB group bacterium]|nr:Rrf2 family transcriptional regulator [FCB group bacterium]MBL7028754.1 Rrf2 family transcriptional regulator [Candidatus Neomarinimicrobiota bacterium]